MSFDFALQKVMNVKEQEQKNSQNQYTEAMNQFEQVATELYDLLKKKEELEQTGREKVTKGISIYELQSSQSQLLRLQQAINETQHTTQLARERMNRKQQDMVKHSIEFKKYEKMKQVKQEQFKEEQRRLENAQMDDIAIQLFQKRWN
ncbi:flagellar biosynthesis chaperone FliJ [Alkalihalophilus marmarensis]|uniref:Flagellar FliJ protein n=1 Tax=Alkalihalophilus marmarensis DSM 21297 TaxID=1188261 RepID=U6SN29_9BACI|nr:flagellar export protein FliJ [Alkalihalophilus marmarensis]ERN53134.1 flagellar biosynthesis chaperone [Alkalihalophilus marmarensis DSM 21297]MCM3489580.1 flagellar biosynthesis chaperone FliJ [Alkalihalophilus marmarensis]